MTAASSASRSNTTPNAAERDASLYAELVLANQILAAQGIVDGWGHVSVRSAHSRDRFLLARSLAPATVTASDILELDVTTGDPVGAGSSYLERHIHAAVYRARPDVNAVVHNHSPGLVAFGVSNVPLRAIAHVSAFLGNGVPIFEIRDLAGPDNGMLVDTPALGDALAEALGAHSLVLMRGHGATVAGESLPHVVYRAVYAAQNARVQREALSLGSVTYLTDGEARLTADTVDRGVGRVWRLWTSELAGTVPPGLAE